MASSTSTQCHDSFILPEPPKESIGYLTTYLNMEMEDAADFVQASWTDWSLEIEAIFSDMGDIVLASNIPDEDFWDLIGKAWGYASKPTYRKFEVQDSATERVEKSSEMNGLDELWKLYRDTLEELHAAMARLIHHYAPSRKPAIGRSVGEVLDLAPFSLYRSSTTSDEACKTFSTMIRSTQEAKDARRRRLEQRQQLQSVNEVGDSEREMTDAESEAYFDQILMMDDLEHLNIVDGG